jgi:hypothetical protein
MSKIREQVRYVADETRVPDVMERERQAARAQGIHVMAQRVSRAVGWPVFVENTGGHTMVATVRAGYGIVIALTVEGYALYENRSAWRDGDEPMVTGTGTPLEIVVEAISWWKTFDTWATGGKS